MENQVDYFTELKERITQIEQHFSIIENSSLSIQLTVEQKQDFICSFILLIHAEFENYFENKATQKLEEGKEIWKQSHIANFHIATLFLKSPPAIENTNKKSNKKSDFEALIDQGISVISKHRTIIKNNHGIKSKDIKKIFEPLGYKVTNFSDTLMIELDSFGAIRGEIAHSSAIKIRQQHDYKTIIEKIKNILSEIPDFEKTLNLHNCQSL